MGKAKSDYVVQEVVKGTYDALLADGTVKTALAYIESDSKNTLDEQIALTKVPAPSYQEQARGEIYKDMLSELGLSDVHVDSVGNVFGIRKGKGTGPTVFVCAHLDTVFPIETDIQVVEKDGLIYAPGISDNGRGLAAVLGLLRAFNHANIETDGDILFGATVGEEGLGDLRGVKFFFMENQVDGFISIEPGNPDVTTYLATGSHRYKITYRGPGGHSFGSFGTPSAIHALGRAIALISDVTVPSDPRTTFTVGEIQGGTSVNTIAAKATMMVDMRSNSEEELLRLEQKVLELIHKAVKLENERWGVDAITVDVELVGNRPAGSQSPDANIVQASMGATAAMGRGPVLDWPSSTDSNVPIHLGVPAVTLGGGGSCGGIHTVDEYFDPQDAHLGVQKIFLTLLGLVGLHGVSEPLLQKR